MAISVDGPDAATHDEFRGIPGTFDRAMFALRHARDIGLDTQFQTTVTRRNMERLRGNGGDRQGSAHQDVEPVLPHRDRARARKRRPGCAPNTKQVFEFMYELSKTAPFGIKTTEAMHYRRYVAQRIKAEHGVTENENAKGVAWRTAGVSDGKGFVFVSHTGEIFPSGFLPVSGGNVLRDSLTDVYRNSDLFRTPARYHPARRQVRPVRIPEDLRRVALARLRPDRRLSGGGPALHLSAASGGSGGGLTGGGG